MKPIRERLAGLLYEMWCVSSDGPRGPGDSPDWETWAKDGALNPVGLKRQDFLEEADKYLAGIAFWEAQVEPR